MADEKALAKQQKHAAEIKKIEEANEKARLEILARKESRATATQGPSTSTKLVHEATPKMQGRMTREQAQAEELAALKAKQVWYLTVSRKVEKP